MRRLIKIIKRLNSHDLLTTSNVVRALMIIIVFAGFGLLFLARSHAATYSVPSETESGVVTGNAAATDDPAASGSRYVKFGATPVTPPGGATVKPTIVGHQLQKGNTGQQLKMAGVCVWGIEDYITEEVGVEQYANRQKVVDTIKSWGANHIRLRLLASDYNEEKFMTKAQYIQQVKDWRDTIEAAGMYMMVTWWDALDGTYEDAGWADKYSQAFPAMTDVVNALGDDPMVIYEPYNEPNGVSSEQWLPAMKATINHFRTTLHYTGVLLIDMTVWSHHYDDSGMTELETYDASLAGMNGKNQLIFAKHDYANEYPDPNNWTEESWVEGGDGWDFSKHLTWETEYGNYNGSPDTVHLSWSQSASTGLAAKISDGTIAGATAFVFNWVDANTMVESDNTTTNTWGGYVKNNLLAGVH